MSTTELARFGITTLALAAAIAVTGCQRAKAPAQSPEPRVSDWDSGLSVELEFEVTELRDSVAVTTVAMATNVTKGTRDICVNLHFVSGFQQPADSPPRSDSSRIEPINWSKADEVYEIARSRWRKYDNANCARRTLTPGMSFEERFDFKYSSDEFAGLEGSVFVMCEIWFQTRVDIPNRSLTCDMGRFGFAQVPHP